MQLASLGVLIKLYTKPEITHMYAATQMYHIGRLKVNLIDFQSMP
jgi:hypothetical protein